MIRLKNELGISAVFNKLGHEISKVIDKLEEIVWENMPGDCLWIKLTENTTGSVKFNYIQPSDPDYTFKLYIKTSLETEWTEIGLKNNDYYRKTFTAPDYLMIKGDVTNTLNGLQIVCENYTDYEVGGRLNALYGKLTGDNTCPANVVRPFYGLFSLSSGTFGGIKYANKLKMPTDTTETCYWQMFKNNSSLEKAPKLPAMSLTFGCYFEMFSGCSSLTTAPDLPATTLAAACYNKMFYECSSLTNAPVLNAKTLVDDCYEKMFEGCTTLKYVKCMATSGFYLTFSPLSNWLYNTAVGDTGQLDIDCGYTSDFEDHVATNWNINELCIKTIRFNQPGNTDYTYIKFGGDSYPNNYAMTTNINSSSDIRVEDYTGDVAEYQGYSFIYDDTNNCVIGISGSYSVAKLTYEDALRYPGNCLWKIDYENHTIASYYNRSRNQVIGCDNFGDNKNIYHDKSGSSMLECEIIYK